MLGKQLEAGLQRRSAARYPRPTLRQVGAAAAPRAKSWWESPSGRGAPAVSHPRPGGAHAHPPRSRSSRPMSSVNELNKNVHMGSFCFCIGVTTSPLGECSCNGDRRDLGGICPAPHPRGCETLRLTQHTSAPSLQGPRSPVGLLHEGTARDRTERERGSTVPARSHRRPAWTPLQDLASRQQTPATSRMETFTVPEPGTPSARREPRRAGPLGRHLPEGSRRHFSTQQHQRCSPCVILSTKFGYSETNAATKGGCALSQGGHWRKPRGAPQPTSDAVAGKAEEPPTGRRHRAAASGASVGEQAARSRGQTRPLRGPRLRS